jgi:hypothetical protein
MADRYQCAPAAESRDEDMFATASNVRAWLLVEVRGAWGVDAVHESALGEFVPRHWKDELHRRDIRAICVRSQQRDEADGVRLFFVVAHRPGQEPAVLWTRDVDGLDSVAGAADELDGRATAAPPGWTAHPDRLVLVCANGRHDQCCANRGRPLIRALRESSWAGALWECSHIGGDRFAANVVVLPDSLYFGRCEVTSIDAVLGTLDDGRIDLEHFRGRSRYSLAEQAVEHFVRRETGVEGLEAVIVGHRDDDGAYAVRLADGGRLRVVVRRSMISVDEALTCKGTAPQLVPRFSLASLEPTE